jgi:phosphoglycerate dehydrogenase-like enzyme
VELRIRALVTVVALAVGCFASTGTHAKKTLKIVVGRLDAQQVAVLKKAAPNAKIIAVADADAALKEIADADALIGLLNEELVKAGKNLKWIQVLSAGVDRYRYPALIDSDIVFTNAKVIQGPNVADQAMALLLAMTRQVVRASVLAQEHEWSTVRGKLRESPHGIIELNGKTALVIGYGGIGAAIAERSRGFGMEIVATAHNADKPHPDWVELHPANKLPELLPRAHVVFLAVPLTDETRGMIDAAALDKMRDGAYLVNIARGPVIDTDALIEALRSGKLAGAGLDVTDPEPLPMDHPLWKLDNVVITPHMGGTSDVVWERRLGLARDNLQAFVQGKPLRNVVDKQAGY